MGRMLTACVCVSENPCSVLHAEWLKYPGADFTVRWPHSATIDRCVPSVAVPDDIHTDLSSDNAAYNTDDVLVPNHRMGTVRIVSPLLVDGIVCIDVMVRLRTHRALCSTWLSKIGARQRVAQA